MKRETKRFELCADCADEMREAYELTVVKGNRRVVCDNCGHPRWGQLYDVKKKEKGCEIS